MVESPRGEFTEILRSVCSSGEDRISDKNQIFEAVYTELHHIASRLMRSQRPDHTLQPTALVHEAYIRLVDPTKIAWKDRVHFFATAARAMRQILIDQARRRTRAKRGGGWQQVTFDTNLKIGNDRDIQVLEFDEVLSRLSRKDDRMAKVVELRVFGGLSAKEVAQTLGVSRRTVQNDWRVALMWLSRELEEGGGN